MFAAPQKEETVKGTATIRVIAILLFAAGGALCQNSPAADKASQPDPAAPPGVQSPETRSWQSLPDAPTPMQPTAQATGAGSGQEGKPANPVPPPETGFANPYRLRTTQNQSSDSFGKYMDFQTPKPDPAYAPSTSGNFLGRATYAASSTFLSHSASGRPRLNTAYFVGMMALAAVHTAYRPYYQRTGGAIVGDFGVTIGSNAGINVFHEFEPAIRSKARTFTPKFIYKLEERFTGSQVPDK